ncbi:MAG TPA: PQQ-binding-like beta-propeller repeat protein, partial [Polyangia bacterium]
MRRAVGRQRVSRPAVALTLAALPLLLGAAPPAGPHPPPIIDAVPPVSSLPRLRPLWTTPGDLSGLPSLLARTPVAAGLALTWAYEKPAALVALDVRTGKERWRLPMPNEDRPEVRLAGDLALVYRVIGATAVDLATGKQRWTRRLCFRSEPATVARPHVAVGVCSESLPPEDATGFGPKVSRARSVMVAIDLDSGRELWRVPTARYDPPFAAAGGLFYVAADPADRRQGAVTVSALDARTGKTLRSFALPQAPSSIRIVPGDAKRALFIGSDIVAVNLADGRVLWQAPGTPPSASQIMVRVPWPELRAGRLFAWNGDRARELDLRTGAEVASWSTPADLTSHVSQMVRPAPGGGVLVIRDRGREPAVAVRFAGPGAAPTLAVLPVIFENVLAVEDD